MCSEHAKQADQSWGAPDGASEWKDEQAGEAIAKADEKEEAAEAVGVPTEGEKAATEVNNVAEATEPEPVDNSRSYDEYLAEQAEKKLKLGGGLPQARKPNEGSKPDKKMQSAKPMAKKGDEEGDYFKGQSEKAKRERQRKEKNVLDVDLTVVESSGGRGGGERGGRGRGRGDRGDRGERGEHRGGRGGPRGGRGDGYRGRGDRGGRGGGGGRGGPASLNVTEQEFPSLGGS